MTWPAVPRWAFIGFLLALLAAICVVQPSIVQFAGLRVHQLAAHFAWVGDTAETLGRAAEILVEHVNRIFVVAAAVIGVVSYLTCIGFGTMIYQLASINRKNLYL